MKKRAMERESFNLADGYHAFQFHIFIFILISLFSLIPLGSAISSRKDIRWSYKDIV